MGREQVPPFSDHPPPPPPTLLIFFRRIFFMATPPTSDYLVLLLRLKKTPGVKETEYMHVMHLYLEISLHTRSLKNQSFFCKCKIASAFFLMESVYWALCVGNDKRRILFKKTLQEYQKN